MIAPDAGFTLPAYEPHPDDEKAVEQSVELFEGHELDRFFDALALSERLDKVRKHASSARRRPSKRTAKVPRASRP